MGKKFVNKSVSKEFASVIGVLILYALYVIAHEVMSNTVGCTIISIANMKTFCAAVNVKFQ